MRMPREWGFPVSLLVAWMAAAAHTVSFVVGPSDAAAPADTSSPAIADTGEPRS